MKAGSLTLVMLRRSSHAGMHFVFVMLAIIKHLKRLPTHSDGNVMVYNKGFREACMNTVVAT